MKDPAQLLDAQHRELDAARKHRDWCAIQLADLVTGRVVDGEISAADAAREYTAAASRFEALDLEWRQR